ncbi:MAG: NAD kinase [Bacteroidota bacterium]
MQIALFGRRFSPEFFPVIQSMITRLESKVEKFLIKDSFFEFIKASLTITRPVEMFQDHKTLPGDCFCMISIGGDGTLLDTMPFVRDSGIPVLGINTGRLGFLSSVSSDDMAESINSLLERNYRIDERSLIELDTGENELFGTFPYALNELTVLKRDTNTMIAVSAYVNGHYLNTYWADGLMVATPTGSTGYSLSCGGPILSPDSENLIITPIASHNLTVRPVIIKDNSLIKLKVEGRTKSHLIIMDSRTIPMEEPLDLYIRKASFKVKLISINNKEFFKTIRNKLAWGFDKRN